MGWTVVDHGHNVIPTDPAASLRTSFRELVLPTVFREALRSINLTADGESWLPDRQLNDLRDQMFRHPNRTLLEASEMEHAIRKHCTVHFGEDPAFYAKLSEKLERLIEQHRDNWKALSDDLEQLRKEAIEGGTDTVEGLTKEATTF